MFWRFTKVGMDERWHHRPAMHHRAAVAKSESDPTSAGMTPVCRVGLSRWIVRWRMHLRVLEVVRRGRRRLADL